MRVRRAPPRPTAGATADAATGATVFDYRLRGARRWMMWWLLGPMLLAGLAMLIGGETRPLADPGAEAAAADRAARVGGAVLAGMAVLGLLGWHWLWRRTRLALSATGPSLHQWGCDLQTPWANVAAFHAEPGLEGFVLHRPLAGKGAQRLALWGNSPVVYPRAAWIAEQRFMPLEPFGWHWRKGTLLPDLQRLHPPAARLMQTALAAAATPEAVAARRLPWFWWLALAALVGVGIALGAWDPPWMDAAWTWVYVAGTGLLALRASWLCVGALRSRRWTTALWMATWTLILAAAWLLAWVSLG